MSDLISREDAINAMMVLKRADDLAYGCEIPESFDSKRAIEALKNIPTAEPERKWIPVTEALPNNAEHDWVLGQIRETDSGYLWIPKVVEYRESSDDWFEDSIGWLKKNPDHAFEVIAWMPLPESYKGD